MIIGNRNMIRLIYILTLLLAVSLSAFGQQPKIVTDAYGLYQQKDYAGAKAKIDTAILMDEASGLSLTWYLRGFIYKELFKTESNFETKEKQRKESAKSILKSFDLPNAEEYKSTSLAAMDFIALTYYNDAGNAINNGEYDKALQMFELHNKYKKIADPSFDFTERQIDFNNAMGGLASDLFERDRENNKDYFDKSLEFYKNVLTLDSLDWNANYNSGILYYNEGVHIINASDEEPDFTSLMEIQDQSRDLFKQALPFMLRAHRLDSSRKNAITALSGIYFSLHDLEQSEYYKGLLEKE